MSKKRNAVDMQDSPGGKDFSSDEQDILTPQEVIPSSVQGFQTVPASVSTSADIGKSQGKQRSQVKSMDDSMDTSTSTPGKESPSQGQGQGQGQDQGQSSNLEHQHAHHKGYASEEHSTPQGSVSVHEFSDDDLDVNAAMMETPRFPHVNQQATDSYKEEDRMSYTKSPLVNRGTAFYVSGPAGNDMLQQARMQNNSNLAAQTQQSGVKRARVPGRGAVDSRPGASVRGDNNNNNAAQDKFSSNNKGKQNIPRSNNGKSKYTGGGGSMYMFKNWHVGDRYKLVKILGHGSYGQVAEGIDVRSGEKVAIKRINSVFDQEIDTKRILREVFILRHLRHDNVIKLLNIVRPRDIEDFNELYLVFEFVDTDLHKLINSPQYLSVEHIKTFLYQLLCGLKYIHSSLVIHRDIKPANILLNENCSLRICDFGLARVVSPTRFVGTAAAAATNAATVAITCCGTSASCTTPGCHHHGVSASDVETGSAGLDSPSTPRKLQRQLTKHVVTRWYRPPELILLQEYTNAVDMWSVGCIFAELLSMQKDSISSFKDRAPLFPGKSCFPLSADNDRTYKDQLDQLNVIFNIIGTPEEHDVSNLGEVKHYLRGLQNKKRKDFSQIFKAAPPDAIALLNQMLVFNPKKRISVDEALDHPFMKSCRVKKNETLADKALAMGGEFVSLSREELRYRLLEEIEHYARLDTAASPHEETDAEDDEVGEEVKNEDADLQQSYNVVERHTVANGNRTAMLTTTGPQ